MESHDEDVTSVECWCTKGTTASQHYIGNFVIRNTAAEVEFEKLFPFRNPDMFGSSGDAQGFFAMNFNLIRDDKFRL
jgi:hypothetical protein